MIDWVVLKQIPTGPCADDWVTVYVNVTAPTPEKAIEEAAIDKGGEGRYVAIPNEFWVAQDVKIKKIAEVTLEKQELV